MAFCILGESDLGAQHPDLTNITLALKNFTLYAEITEMTGVSSPELNTTHFELLYQLYLWTLLAQGTCM